jgi:hypothetical protein
MFRRLSNVSCYSFLVNQKDAGAGLEPASKGYEPNILAARRPRYVVRPTGIEPVASDFVDPRSVQLSYGRKWLRKWDSNPHAPD